LAVRFAPSHSSDLPAVSRRWAWIVRGGIIVKDVTMTDDDIELLKQFSERYPPLINIKEAAEIARVPSPQSIYFWSSSGVLDACKVKCGRRVLFKRDAFVRFVLGAG
jgi:Helix-turn-helix domain